jgi:hypothetical protein
MCAGRLTVEAKARRQKAHELLGYIRN